VRRLAVFAVVASLSACAEPADEVAGGAGAALVAGSDTDELRVVSERAGARLWRGSPSAPAPQTDERPTYRMVVEAGSDRVEPAARVLAGVLVEGGVLWVTPEHELRDGQGSVLDRAVVPELAVSVDGRMVAYPHRAGDAAGVYVIARDGGGWSRPRRVTAGLALADRPLFLDDGRLVVIGAVASGIAGVWLVDPRRDAQPVPVTNERLRTGRPLGPTFVPPPAYHESMRARAGALVYDDGYGERRVELPAEGTR